MSSYYARFAVPSVARALTFGGPRDPRALAVLGTALMGYYAQNLLRQALSRDARYTAVKPIVRQVSVTHDVPVTQNLSLLSAPQRAGLAYQPAESLFTATTWPDYYTWTERGFCQYPFFLNPAADIGTTDFMPLGATPDYSANTGRYQMVFARQLSGYKSAYVMFASSAPPIGPVRYGTYYTVQSVPISYAGVQGGAAPSAEAYALASMAAQLSYTSYDAISPVDAMPISRAGASVVAASSPSTWRPTREEGWPVVPQPVRLPSQVPAVRFYVTPHGSVRADGVPHVLSRPPSGVKERKVSLNSGAAAYYKVMSFYGRYTEGRDFVNAVYYALPYSARVVMFERDVMWTRWVRGADGKPVKRRFVKHVVVRKRKPSMAEKLVQCFKHWEALDAKKAASNIFFQEAEDFAVAFKHTFDKPVAQMLGLPVGLQYKGGILRAAPSLAKDARGLYDLVK